MGSACGTPAPSTPHPTAQVLHRRDHTVTGHHGTGLKAVSAGAFEASDDVGAGAFPTGVPNGALVCVCGGVQGGQCLYREPLFLHSILSACPLTATAGQGRTGPDLARLQAGHSAAYRVYSMNE